MANESYGSIDYERGYDLTLQLLAGVRGFTAGAEVLAGQDVFGESFSRIAGFVRFGDEWAGDAGGGWAEDVVRPRGAELFVGRRHQLLRGGHSSRRWQSGDTPRVSEVAPHFAIGARRAVSERSDLGVRAEIDRHR